MNHPPLSFPSSKFGDTEGHDIAYGVSADADGSFFVAGLTEGSVDDEFANAGGSDFTVAKVSGVDGSVLWYWQVGAHVDLRPCLASTMWHLVRGRAD